MIGLRKKEKIKKIIQIYTELLDKEINEGVILIHEVENNKDNIPNKQTVKGLNDDLQFLKGEVQSKRQVLRDLKLILRNENLMDDWKASAGEVNLRL